MVANLTLTAVFTPDEDGWTMAQLAEWPAVVTCGRTVEEACEMLLDAAREMLASYRDEGREPPIGGGHVEPIMQLGYDARSGVVRRCGPLLRGSAGF